MYKKFDLFFGFFVIGVFVWFLFTLCSSVLKPSSRFSIHAVFSSADGVLKGSDVKIAGVKIGEVEQVYANPSTFSADVTMKINSNFKIPIDSSASIQSSGIFGAKYIEISAGADSENLKDNGLIQITQSSLNLEKLISTFASSGLKK